MTKEEKVLQTMQGARVRHVRETKDLSQAEFAEKLHITQQALGKIELGKAKLTERNLEAICRFFNVNPQWLRTGVGERFLPAVDVNNEYLLSLCKEFHLGCLEAQVLEKYLSFPPELRIVISDWMLKTFDFINDLDGASKTKKKKDDLQIKIDEGQAAQKELDEIKNAEYSANLKDTLNATG